jgi:hypothetical protein
MMPGDVLPCPRCGAELEADPVPEAGWIAHCPECEETAAAETPERAVTMLWCAVVRALRKVD